ncbi:MAG: endonuclease III [Clostridiaceae bacterium]|jgi:endonuclease-3|nr:endonuclease III [Clostridiaceae bacterium]
MDKKQRAKQIIEILHETYPDVETTLDATSAWELLVGGILASQCTDERVNKITPHLFAAYPTIADMAEADVADIENIIRACGIYRNKAKAIKGSAEIITEEHGSQVPRTREQLMELPGVGRKIANLMLGDAFGEQAVVVDTHCARISRLLGMTAEKDPAKIEGELEAVLPPDSYTDWGHFMVFHGRTICKARCRDCVACPLRQLCAYGSQQNLEGKEAGDCV